MKTIVKYVYYVFFIAFPVILNSQISLQGNVKGSDGLTLPYANILVKEVNKVWVADDAGKFEIQLKPGIYTIQFSYIGYKPLKIVVKALNDTSLNEIQLQTAVIETQEFVVEESQQSGRNSMAISTQKISPKELLSSGQDLAASLNYIPGVQAAQYSGGVFKPVIRGMQGNRVTVFAQNVRIESLQGQDDHGLSINNWANGGVEIIKGPASLIYGPGSMGGVLIFHDDLPAPVGTTKGFVNYRFFTSTLGNSLVANFKQSLQKFQYGIFVTGDLHKDFTQAGFIRVPNTRYHNASTLLWAQTEWKKHIFHLSYSYFVQNSGLLPEEEEFIEDQYSIHEPYLQTTQQIFSLKHTWINKNSMWKNIIGLTKNNRKEFEEMHEDSSVIEHEHHHDDASLDFGADQIYWQSFVKKSFNKNSSFTVGTQNNFLKYQSKGHEKIFPDGTSVNLGFYLLYEFEKQRLKTSTGLRTDYNITQSINTFVEDSLMWSGQKLEYFNFPVFSMGVIYKLLTKWTLDFYASGGYRPPSFTELWSNGEHHGAFRYEIGNDQLKPEKNFEISFGSTYESEHIKVSGSVYYNHILNYIDLIPRGNFIESFPVFIYTQYTASLRGVEGMLEWHPHPFDWLHLQTSVNMIEGKSVEGNYLYRIPPMRWMNEIEVEKDWDKTIRHASFGVQWLWVDRQNRVGPNETTTPGYDLLNVYLKTHWKLANRSLYVNLRANNVLDRKYVDHLSYFKNTPGFYQQGFNMMIELHWEF